MLYLVANQSALSNSAFLTDLLVGKAGLPAKAVDIVLAGGNEKLALLRSAIYREKGKDGVEYPRHLVTVVSTLVSDSQLKLAYVFSYGKVTGASRNGGAARAVGSFSIIKPREGANRYAMETWESLYAFAEATKDIERDALGMLPFEKGVKTPTLGIILPQVEPAGIVLNVVTRTSKEGNEYDAIVGVSDFNLIYSEKCSQGNSVNIDDEKTKEMAENAEYARQGGGLGATNLQ